MCLFRISAVHYNVGQRLMSVQLQFQLSVLTVRQGCQTYGPWAKSGPLRGWI